MSGAKLHTFHGLTDSPYFDELGAISEVENLEMEKPPLTS